MLYKYETHCHSRRCSRCAHSTPAELVRAYKEKGFAGLVLTDHFIYGNNCINPTYSWEKKMHCYYDAFLEAKEEGAFLDFDVFFGIEHAYDSGLEVLCYGIGLDFLLSNPNIPQLDLVAFAERVHNYGGLLIHAHPYRWAGPELQLPLDILDGIEVYNAGNRPDKNLLAQRLADKTGLIQTSGSDLHNITEPKLGTAGIALPYRLQNDHDLIRSLKCQEHSLILP